MSQYHSIFSPDKCIRADQYIIEKICQKNAKQTGRELPVQFWELPEWSKFYRSQLRKCKALLEQYSAEAIIKALDDKRAYKIYSLFAPWLPGIIAEYQTSINNRPTESIPTIEGGTNFYRKPIKKQSLRDRLDDL